MFTSTYKVACITSTNSDIYIGCKEYGGLWKSSNGGLNWFSMPLGSYYVYGIYASGSRVVAGCAGLQGVWISTNSGLNWHQSSLVNETIWCMNYNGSYLYAGTMHGVFYSTNSGKNWIQTSNNSGNVYTIYSNGPYVLTGNSYGTGFSQDYGNNWINSSANLTNVYVKSTFIDNNYMYAGTYEFGLWRRPISEVIGIRNISETISTKYLLMQNYPNPFNLCTKIKFNIPERNKNEKDYITYLRIYNSLGKEVKVLINDILKPGYYEANFHGTDLPSGIYFYQLKSNNFFETKKMILIK